MSNIKRHFSTLLITFIFSSIIIFAQNYNIDYYGIVSTEIDSNMAKMTSDLYYTQLSEINNFSVSDKRTDILLSKIPNNSFFSNTALSFYTEIKKEENSDKWITTIYVVDKASQEIHSKEKTYDSYYKILMESKNDLRNTIKQLIENDSTKVTISTNTNISNNNSISQDKSISSTEVLSGTWIGEEAIEKIVILRGGRGFVIFKNGASMNISVEITNENKIVITQKGKSNASFYPELPRNIALNAALSAEPIQWTLTFLDNNSLSGTKTTLLPKGDDYINGKVNIEWKRIN